jgi:serine/threonine-protein kinase RsbT
VKHLREEMRAVLMRYVSEITADAILVMAGRNGLDFDHLREGDGARLLSSVGLGIRIYIPEPARQKECVVLLERLVNPAAAPAENEPRQATVEINQEADIVTARMKGQMLCQEVGFSPLIQVKVATAISELTRNIVRYAGRGTMVIRSLDGSRPGIEVVASDQGPGIADLETILGGSYRSRTGMGLGLLGTKRLMDSFEVETAPGRGTTVTARKYLS